jgi:asparagine synthase (glutamine-hydrolysing)
MCGIAGTLDMRSGLESAEEVVVAMTAAIAHRGPDDAGVLVDPPCALGHRRLSIIDLSSAGHQPMASADGERWIVFNGEIYNYVEIRRELVGLGRRFATQTDTEVLLQAYDEWGEAALPRLNGMFAFAIWDRARQTLFCARDRFGVKPFYYTVAGHRFRFVSEIKALFADPAVARRPNDPRVRDFLAWGVADHTSETMFEGVYQLPPGTFSVIGSDGRVPEPQRWYRPSPAPLNGADAAEVVRSLLESAVELRLRSDVPVGVSLSGGMDSSSVLALATRARVRQGAEAPRSFSGRSREPRRDEYRYSVPLLRMTGSENATVLPTAEGLIDELDALLWHIEEPFHAPSVYAQRKVHELARTSGVTVLLDGNGGDEALSGYHHLHYPAILYSLLRNGRLAAFAREAGARRTVHKLSLGRTGRDIIKLALPDFMRPRHAPAWIMGSDSLPRQPAAVGGLRAHQLFGIEVSPLPGYNHHNDRNSMSWSLEARNPFLDYRLIEAGLALAIGDLLNGGISKWSLREAMRDLLPTEIVDRPTKQGFTADEADWLRGPLGQEFEALFASPSVAERGYVVPAALATLLAEHRAGGERSWELWRAYVVERWLRRFVDPPVLERPSRPAHAPAAVPLVEGKIVRLEPVTRADELGVSAVGA